MTTNSNSSDGGSTVELWVYDLSRGMARQLSMGLAGRQIDGIWHTSVVVFGKEHCFGQGIEIFEPGSAPHGVPVNKITMGTTHIPQDVFEDYLADQRTVWTADKYHLLDNNCNSFSDELCLFLVGKSIPSHITSLPAEFINTPFGQSILPMIENMFGRSNQAAISRPPTVPAAPASGSAASTAGPRSGQLPPDVMAAVSALASAAGSSLPKMNHPVAHVKPCTSLSEFRSLLATHRCVAVDFTAQNCGPCRMISPEFDRIITEANETFKPLGLSDIPKVPILGLSVEVGNARELSSVFQITATPTFMFFLDGKKFHEFRGADRAELKSSVDLLLFTAFPPHPHGKLDLRVLTHMRDGEPIRFVQSSNLDAIFTKMKSLAQASNITWNEPVSQALLAWMKKPAPRGSIGDVNGWQEFLSTLLLKLSIDQAFPVLDVIRLLLLEDPVVSVFFLTADTTLSLLDVMKRIVDGADKVSKPSRLMLLRVGCNLFKGSDPSVPMAWLSLDARATLTQVVVDHLLSPEPQLRQAAALLVFNISWSVTSMRHGNTMADESWISEFVAALCNAIQVESAMPEGDDEVALRLVAALGLFVAFAAPMIAEIAQSVEVAEHIKAISVQRTAAVKTLKASLAAKSAEDAASIRKTIEKKEFVIKAANEVSQLIA